MSAPITEYLEAARPWLPIVQPTAGAEWLAWVDRLVAAGVQVIEVPLRDAHAVHGLTRARAAFPHLIIAAGTVCSVADARVALAAGAHFLVSPGVVPELLAWTTDQAVPWLPGVATATDILQCQTLDHPYRKFFPAEAAGGVPALKALSCPFAELQFVPSGGLNPALAVHYLMCPNVPCVSASWQSSDLQPNLAAQLAQLRGEV